MPVGKDLLTQWFENDIAPLYSQRQELKRRSIRRKVGTLQQSVEAALQARLRSKGCEPAIDGEKLRDVEARLRQASGKLQETHTTAQKITDEIGTLASRSLWNRETRGSRGGPVLAIMGIVLPNIPLFCE